MTWNELLDAANDQALQRVEPLIESVLDRETCNTIEQQNTIELLACTIKNDWIHILRCLYQQYRIDVNLQCGTKGNTALHFAVLKEKEACVRFLLDMGARVTIRNASNQTPLFYAVNNFPILKMLLQILQEQRKNTAVETNLQDEYGSAPLHRIAELCVEYTKNIQVYEQSIVILIEHGADPYLKDHAGKRPIDWMPQALQESVRSKHFNKVFNLQGSTQDLKIFEYVIYHSPILVHSLLFQSFKRSNDLEVRHNATEFQKFLGYFTALPAELRIEICIQFSAQFCSDIIEKDYLRRLFVHSCKLDNINLYEAFCKSKLSATMLEN